MIDIIFIGFYVAAILLLLGLFIKICSERDPVEDKLLSLGESFLIDILNNNKEVPIKVWRTSYGFIKTDLFESHTPLTDSYNDKIERLFCIYVPDKNTVYIKCKIPNEKMIIKLLRKCNIDVVYAY